MNYARFNIFNILDANESVFLFGPRGVGKTSIVREFLKKTKQSLYIDLLRSSEYNLYLSSPERLRQEILALKNNSEVTCVVIDEIQKLPGLLDEVHSLIEEFPNQIRFILTGSSARKLKRGQANMLAGRASTLYLHPLSSSEIEIDLNRALHIGTLPAIYSSKRNPPRMLSAYVEIYLKEEIFQEALVRNVQAFSRFIEIAAQYHGQLVNYTRIAKAAKIATTTCQEYFSILKDTLIAWEIPGWHESVRHQLTLSPRFYLFDCGVLNAILGELSLTLRPHTSRYGKLFETWVILEILRNNQYRQYGYHAYHWRTSHQKEIDLILKKNNYEPPIAIEIKSSSIIENQDIAALKLFKEEYPDARLLCLSNVERKFTLNEVEILPWKAGIVTLFEN